MIAIHPVFFRSVVFSKDFPREVCASNESLIDSLGRDHRYGASGGGQ